MVRTDDGPRAKVLVMARAEEYRVARTEIELLDTCTRECMGGMPSTLEILGLGEAIPSARLRPFGLTHTISHTLREDETFPEALEILLDRASRAAAARGAPYVLVDDLEGLIYRTRALKMKSQYMVDA
ncbi:MAG: hypothetical protein JXP34_22080 [Planctomycetes bacterium]|nr:hypothetical protein [Planctomycetota bacterium]